MTTLESSKSYYNSDDYAPHKEKNVKLSYLIIMGSFLVVIVLFYYIIKLLITIHVSTLIHWLFLIGAIFGIIFFMPLGFVGFVLTKKRSSIQLTNTHFLYRTPFNSIPLMEKNQDISYNQIKEVFSNELNQFPMMFIVLRDNAVIPISKTDIPEFDLFIKILKSRVKIISDDQWNYKKVKQYIRRHKK